MLMIQPEVLQGEKTPGNSRKLTRPLHCPIACHFLYRILQLPQRKTKWGCADTDTRRRKQGTKRGWEGRGKNNTERGQVPSTVCYLASLASCVEQYQHTHPVKLLTADNKALGHTAKFFICVYPAWQSWLETGNIMKPHCFLSHSSFSFRTRRKCVWGGGMGGYLSVCGEG